MHHSCEFTSAYETSPNRNSSEIATLRMWTRVYVISIGLQGCILTLILFVVYM